MLYFLQAALCATGFDSTPSRLQSRLEASKYFPACPSFTQDWEDPTGNEPGLREDGAGPLPAGRWEQSTAACQGNGEDWTTSFPAVAVAMDSTMHSVSPEMLGLKLALMRTVCITFCSANTDLCMPYRGKVVAKAHRKSRRRSVCGCENLGETIGRCRVSLYCRDQLSES